MASSLSKARQERRYDEAAQEYLRNLPLEHFMEATEQSTQRKITLESLDLVTARRPDVHVFNELLVQYPLHGTRKLGQIVPDNMVVLHDGPIAAKTNYAIPNQPAPPFWVFEYVSRSSWRKDYEKSFAKYERELRVPYYLIFYPDILDLSLYHLKAEKYVSVKPNKQGRYSIRDLDLEVGMLDGWVRFWHARRLLPLPAELLRDLEQAKRRVVDLEHRLQAEEKARRAMEEELARLRARLGQSPHRLGNKSRYSK
jgi:Uma2 family endonuclease